jgi:uncharacterized protein (TIGR02145 family)
MKRLLKIIIIAFFTICLIVILHSCKKKTEPDVKTAAVSGITQTSAESGGKVTNNGGVEVTARGVCWSTSQNPSINSSKTSNGTGNGEFISNITDLNANTKYYVRAYATNSEGTGYGNEILFTTSPIIIVPPTVTTGTTTATSSATATSGGNVTSDGGATVTVRGVCWSTSANPTIALSTKTSDGTGTGTFTSNIPGLTANTTYHVRAYATNNAGTGYGEDVTITTYATTDIDGNNYSSVTIGTQVWMAENLKVTKYNDNATVDIPNVTGEAAWTGLTTPAYCWYNNNAAAYKATYGALYNWYTVDAASNGGKNVCPAGWHVPTDAEWTTLTNYLGGESIAGGKLKEIGTTHWTSPNTGATDETGFTAIPGGARNYDGTFRNIGNYAGWWSATEFGPSSAWSRSLYYNDTDVNTTDDYKKDGLSVRCLKDN